MISPSPLKAILFDVGQTIFSPDYIFLKDMLAGFGVHTTVEVLGKGAALGREKFFRGNHGEQWKDYFMFWLRYAGAPPQDLEAMLKLIHERHQREHLWNYLEPTARQTFDALQQLGLRLGIISNADGTVASLLQQHGLAHFFACLIDSHLVGVEKPSPEIFQLALAQLELSAASCLYVGDNYDKDVRGARNAGLTPILIDPYDVVPENDVVKIKTLAEVVSLVNQNHQPRHF
jgi:HAD superfamily hydrolase (TIGR01549 family)